MRQRAVILSLAVALAALTAMPGFAQTADGPPPASLEITTPYPAIAVQAGDTASLDLTVRAPDRRQVDLAVDGVPDGWSAVLRGGGFVVDGVTADPESPPIVTLDVTVPAEAADGVQTLTVHAEGGGQQAALQVALRVSEQAAGDATLTTDFPILQGPSDATFAFDLTLVNDTPAEETFALAAQGPPGWNVTVTPSGEAQATTSTLEGGGSGTVRAEVDPPDDAAAGSFEVTVRATGSRATAETVLTVELTGNPEISLTTADERLNAEVSVGAQTDVVLLLSNSGSAPLVDVSLNASPPAGWEVSFDPETVPQVGPGEVVEVTATMAPASDSVAGDYLVTLRASSTDAGSDVVEIRTEVGRSSTAGVIGIALIAMALLALVGVFRGLGRR